MTASTPSLPSSPTREGDDRRAGTVRGGDGAVSPVVGMILVLGVSVVGVTAVLYWGVPMMSQLKADAEFQSVTNQFQQLDANIDELSRGTPGQTAKRWQPAFQRGAVGFQGTESRWIVGADVVSGENWSVKELYDRNDNLFTVINNGTDHTSIKVKAWTVDAGVTDPVNVSTDAPSCDDPTPMSGTTVTAGSELDLCLFYTNGTALETDGETLKFEIRDTVADEALARFYLVDVGRVKYTMTLGTSERNAYHTNGAVVTGDPEDLELANDPPFGPPRTAGSGTRFFARVVELDGSSSFGGSADDRHRVLLTLYSTDVLMDAEGAEDLKVWVDGETAHAWYDYFLRDNTAYAFDEVKGNGAPAFLEYDPSEGFDLKMVHSVIRLEVT